MDSKMPLTDSNDRGYEIEGRKLSVCNLERGKSTSEPESKIPLNSILCKRSMIPRPKVAKSCQNDVQKKPSKCKAKPRPSNLTIIDSEYDIKLKKLEEKENSIAEYYLKIEALIRTMLEKKTHEKCKIKPASRKTLVQCGLSRKMVSDPLVFKKENLKNNIISEFENGMYEISDIWLKASDDLSNVLQILRKDLPLYPVDFEMKRVTIQKAIRRARSFTMMKTRNVIAEAKKLLTSQDGASNELASTSIHDNKSPIKTETKADKQFNKKNDNCNKVPDSYVIERSHCNQNVADKQMIGDGNDLSEPFKDSKTVAPYDTQTQKETEASVESSLNDKEKSMPNIKKRKDSISCTIKEKEKCDSSKNRKENDESIPSVKAEFTASIKKGGKESDSEFKKNDSEDYKPFLKNCMTDKEMVNPSQTTPKDWEAELENNEKTIVHLKNKVFELQRVCNEHFLKCNELQLKLVDFSRKIRWDQVLLRKNQNLEGLKGSQSVKELLEAQNKEWESKATKLAEELEILMKLNYGIIQQKMLINQHDKFVQTSYCEKKNDENEQFSLENLEKRYDVAEKIICEKQNVIDQLKSILKLMKDQENLAQMHKAEFESQIEGHKNLQN